MISAVWLAWEIFFFVLFVFWHTGDQAQYLLPANQALYHGATSPVFMYFILILKNCTLYNLSGKLAFSLKTFEDLVIETNLWVFLQNLWVVFRGYVNLRGTIISGLRLYYKGEHEHHFHEHTNCFPFQSRLRKNTYLYLH